MATNSKSLRYREVEVEGIIRMVPSGVARNNRNKCWQVKVEKNGAVVLKGNYTDELYGDAGKSLRAATKALMSSLETVEQAAADSKRPSEVETAQITLRSSLMWFPSMGSLKLRINVYDRKLKKNHAIYIGTGKSLIKKPDQTIDKIATALSLDKYLEQEGEYQHFKSCFNLLDVDESIMDMAREVYRNHVVTYHKLAA